MFASCLGRLRHMEHRIAAALLLLLPPMLDARGANIPNKLIAMFSQWGVCVMWLVVVHIGWGMYYPIVLIMTGNTGHRDKRMTYYIFMYDSYYV